MFFQVALGAISVGVILMIGFLLIAQIRSSMPSESELNGTNITEAVVSTQAIIISGFGLLAVGVIVLSAFGIVNIFK